MKKFKLFMILSLILLITLPVSAAASPGGWTVAKVRHSFLTSGQEKIFNKAVDKLVGVKYEPAALLAKQTVAGTNYVFLCQGTTVTAKSTKDWYILTASKSLKNKVTLRSVKKIKLSSIKTNKNPRTVTLDGGLQIVPVKNKPETLSASARKVFRNGTKNYVGYNLRPIALLGTQVVAGKNYRFLCYAAGIGTNAASKDIFVVDIYKDVKGKCSVSSCRSMKLEEYV